MNNINTIGIIAAMEEEVSNLKEKMEIKVTKSAVGNEFYIGNFAGKNIVLVKCGIGKVNAAVCTQALIDMFAVDCVINTGVAGGIFNDIRIGDIVVSTDAVEHDMDCSVFGDPIGTIPRMKTSVFKADDELINYAEKAFADLNLEGGTKLFLGRVASGDFFVASKEQKRAIWDNVKGYCCEMEGAAIAHTCYLNNMPYVVIRAISDNADNTGEVDFDKFVVKAAEMSSALTEKMIEYI